MKITICNDRVERNFHVTIFIVSVPRRELWTLKTLVHKFVVMQALQERADLRLSPIPGP